MQSVMRMVALVAALGGLAPNVGCSDDDVKVDSGAVEAGRHETSVGDVTVADVAVEASSQDTGSSDTAAHAPDLTCAGVPLPETVPATVTISGSTQKSDRTPIPALIEVRSADDDSVLDSMTTAADGQYTLTVATGGAPKAVYFHIVAAGYVETYRYFGYPLTGNTTSSQRVWSPAEVETFAGLGGITPTAGKGHLLINLRDCALALLGVPGAEVTTTPAAPIFAYEAGPLCNMPDRTLTASTACSQAFAYDLDPGQVSVQASFGTLSMRTQNVKVAADAMTWVVLQPGR